MTTRGQKILRDVDRASPFAATFPDNGEIEKVYPGDANAKRRINWNTLCDK